MPGVDDLGVLVPTPIQALSAMVTKVLAFTFQSGHTRGTDRKCGQSGRGCKSHCLRNQERFVAQQQLCSRFRRNIRHSEYVRRVSEKKTRVTLNEFKKRNRQISRRIKKHLWLSNRSWARDVHSFGILHSWGALAGKSCSAQASSIWLIAGAFRRTQSK